MTFGIFPAKYRIFSKGFVIYVLRNVDKLHKHCFNDMLNNSNDQISFETIPIS